MKNIKQFGCRSGPTECLGLNCLQSYEQMTKDITSKERVKVSDSPKFTLLLLDFSLNVKAAPHEWVIRTNQP